MKILYVVHDNKKGGAAISFLEMSGEISRQHEIYVITPHKNGFLPEQLSKCGIVHRNAHYFTWLVERDASKAITAIRYIIYAILCRYNYIEAIRVAHILKREHFDIVHTNASTINFGALLAKKLGIPHVWHIREAADYINLMPVIDHDRMGAFFYKYSDKIICISEYIKSYMDDWIIQGLHKDNKKKIKDTKTICVYNGVYTENTIPKNKFPKQGEIIKFLISGTVCRMKGHWTLLDACTILLDKGYGDRFKIFVAGTNNDSEFETDVLKRNLSMNFILLGNVDNMEQLRKNTDVEIVATSLEAFGRVSVEAMRGSNPVIGTKSGGTLEIVIAGENGFLFSPGNANELAECMEKFIHNTALIESMGKNAFESSVNRFTQSQNAQNVINVYTDLIGV